MLEKIDSSLIYGMQWVVRQIELFTNISRSEILTFVTKLLLYFILTLSVMLSIGITITFITQGSIQAWQLLLCSNCFIFFQMWKHIKYLAETSSNSKELLPKEIYARKTDRKIMLSIILFVIILLTAINYGMPQNIVIAIASLFPDIGPQHWLVTESSALFNVCIVIYLGAEYLLCTTSLPPGEKEKRKIEKETRNMTPINIKN